jgi:hypothetical protein
VGLVPVVVRKPAVALRWLAGARAPQIGLVLLVLVVPLGLPAVLDPALERMYPPVRTQKTILGFFERTVVRPDPRRARRRQQVTAITWTGGFACVALLLLAALPNALARAGREAEEREGRGDSLLLLQPAHSLDLYQSALALATDPTRQATLSEKIRKVESLITRARVGAQPALGGEVASQSRVLDPGKTVIDPVVPLLSGDGHERGVVAEGNRYLLQRELGRGGMGAVYHALDTLLDREVALKELPLHLTRRSELARRFRQEARVLARLSHPNIVQVYDLIEDGGRLWIAMEFVEGGTIADSLERDGALAWPEVVRLGRQMAAGLSFAHQRGVIHRDMKPVNILLTSDGGIPKITDFGLARLLESSVHTQEGSLLGSARYMSPEQATGRPADARSDIYSLGITFYEMASGHAPFQGEVAAILAQHLSTPPPRLAELVDGLPSGLEELVMSMLEKEPERRPADVDVVIDVLSSLTT